MNAIRLLQGCGMVLRGATPSLMGLWFVLISSPPAFGSDGLPRYRLEVGQQLTYKQTSEFKYEGRFGPGVYSVTTDWNVWVVRANKDGSRRLVLHSTQKSARKVTGTKPYSLSNTRTALAYFDLYPDGRIVANESLGNTISPEAVFPRLPANVTALKQGWKDHVERNDDLSRYRFADKAKTQKGEWAFEQVRENPLDSIYLLTFRATFFFDRSKGNVSRAESSNTQAHGYKGQGSGTIARTASRTCDADWVKRFTAQADRYFAATKQYTDLTIQAEKSPKDCKDLLERAKKALDDARETVTLPLLREQLDEQIKKHGDLARNTMEDAKRRFAQVGKPAPAWKLEDLQGKEHSLKDYRGKVVVLDFWYRNCGWCVRAMPQLVDLAEDFKGRPVVFLGMNIDEDEKDARFVVQKMKLNYPNLKARGVPQLYEVSAYPTLILIDPKGNLAEVHVGYTATLRKDIGASIRRLLEKR